MKTFILNVIFDRYYALAAASALITYLQNNWNIFYSTDSLHVQYQESEGHAVIGNMFFLFYLTFSIFLCLVSLSFVLT